MTAIAVPMPRRDNVLWIAAGVSLAVHAALFAILSLIAKVPPPPSPAPMDVTIADDVGLQATAPTPPTESAAARSPDVGPTEESSPPPVPSEARPDPAPPAPQPKAAPAPKPPAIAKSQPAKPMPASAPPTKTQSKPAVAPPSKPAAKAGKGAGSDAASNRTANRKPLFSREQMESWGKSPDKPTTAPPGAAANGKQQADFRQRIADQIQPCAINHRLPPTPGINGVRVVMTLSFARDGRPMAQPRIVRIEGLSDEAQRYADLIRRSALATFSDRQCQPIRGLDPDLYDVPNGWRSVTLGFKLPG